jgi:adenine deaminase
MTLKPDAATLQRRIAQGRGKAPADCVVTDVRLLDLVTGTLTRTDIAICGDMVVGTYGSYRGRETIDGRGRIAVPGFIDTHLHVESSLVTPLEFDRCVLPHGLRLLSGLCRAHRHGPPGAALELRARDAS